MLHARLEEAKQAHMSVPPPPPPPLQRAERYIWYPPNDIATAADRFVTTWPDMWAIIREAVAADVNAIREVINYFNTGWPWFIGGITDMVVVYMVRRHMPEVKLRRLIIGSNPIISPLLMDDDIFAHWHGFLLQPRGALLHPTFAADMHIAFGVASMARGDHWLPAAKLRSYIAQAQRLMVRLPLIRGAGYETPAQIAYVTNEEEEDVAMCLRILDH